MRRQGDGHRRGGELAKGDLQALRVEAAGRADEHQRRARRPIAPGLVGDQAAAASDPLVDRRRNGSWATCSTPFAQQSGPAGCRGSGAGSAGPAARRPAGLQDRKPAAWSPGAWTVGARSRWQCRPNTTSAGTRPCSATTIGRPGQRAASAARTACCCAASTRSVLVSTIRSAAPSWWAMVSRPPWADLGHGLGVDQGQPPSSRSAGLSRPPGRCRAVGQTAGFEHDGLQAVRRCARSISVRVSSLDTVQRTQRCPG